MAKLCNTQLFDKLKEEVGQLASLVSNQEWETMTQNERVQALQQAWVLRETAGLLTLEMINNGQYTKS